MAEMTRSASVSILAAEFDNFLFAPIGKERNGMLLSVVSALARLNVDPWPVTTAARRLASLIAALPERPSTHLDPGSNAARLIARLPRPAGFKIVPIEAWRNGGARSGMQLRAPHYIALMIVFLLGGLGIAAGELAVTQVKRAVPPASSTVIPPPAPGQ
jgi:hypothetical protein